MSDRTRTYRDQPRRMTARDGRERMLNGIRKVNREVGDLRRDTRQLAFTTGMTPPPFAGDVDEDVEEHIEQCERCILINAWTKKVIVKSLSFALESRSKYAFRQEVRSRLEKLRKKESKGDGKAKRGDVTTDHRHDTYALDQSDSDGSDTSDFDCSDTSDHGVTSDSETDSSSSSDLTSSESESSDSEGDSDGNGKSKETAEVFLRSPDTFAAETKEMENIEVRLQTAEAGITMLKEQLKEESQAAMEVSIQLALLQNKEDADADELAAAVQRWQELEDSRLGHQQELRDLEQERNTLQTWKPVNVPNFEKGDTTTNDEGYATAMPSKVKKEPKKSKKQRKREKKIKAKAKRAAKRAAKKAKRAQRKEKLKAVLKRKKRERQDEIHQAFPTVKSYFRWLRKTFGRREVRENFQAAFYGRKMRYGERCQDFALELSRLNERSNAPESERVLINKFVNGLVPRLKSAMKKKMKSDKGGRYDWSDVVRAASRLERRTPALTKKEQYYDRHDDEYQSVEEGNRRSTYANVNMASVREEERESETVEVDAAVDERAEMQSDMMGMMKQMMQAIKSNQDTTQKLLNQPPPPPGGRGGFPLNRRNGGYRDPRNVTCFNCMELGHYSPQCPHPPSANSLRARGGRPNGAANPRSAASLDPVCNRCNQMGHYASNCPQRATSKSGATAGDRETGRPPLRNMRCFRCQQEGHLARECPNATDANKGDPRKGNRPTSDSEAEGAAGKPRPRGQGNGQRA